MGCRAGLDVAPVGCDIQGRPDFFGGPACGGEPSPGVPGIVPASFCNVLHHTLRSSLQLIGQRLIVLTNRVKKGDQLSHYVPCSVVNVRLFHERLLGLGLGLTSRGTQTQSKDKR